MHSMAGMSSLNCTAWRMFVFCPCTNVYIKYAYSHTGSLFSPLWKQMRVNGIKGNRPLSLNDQGRESSAELLAALAQAHVILSGKHHVPPRLLKSSVSRWWLDLTWAWILWRRSGVSSPSPSHVTPEGHCCSWAKELCGVAAKRPLGLLKDAERGREKT